MRYQKQKNNAVNKPCQIKKLFKLAPLGPSTASINYMY